ncbi:MAG: hypothetical protein P0Y66_18845 [Candidatus Kaistia colombiensis]|nr:MAG: hypothetical protein P0Y66_18845 [Kaistia sp.]
MQFNHVANRLDAQHFETIVALFIERLGFVELRRTERVIWMRQPGANIDLQFCQSTEAGRDEDKRRSQVSFLSLTPQQALEDLAAWLTQRGLEATVRAYSDREFYLDVPEALVDFVIEAMRPELADYPVKV